MERAVIACAFLALVAACGAPRQARGDRRILAAADEAASAVLVEANRDELYGDDRPFKLKDYRRRISGTDEFGVWVFYEISRPVAFLGHPQHFTVIVDPRTLKTRVMGGE